MQLTKAKRKATIQTLLGFFLIFISICLLLITAYFLLSSLVFTGILPYEISEIVMNLSGTVGSLRENFAILFHISPHLSYPAYMSNIDIFAAVSLLGVIIMGIMMIKSAIHLSNRIRIICESKGTVIKKQNLEKVEITLEHKDIWYKNPIGMISLLLACNYLFTALKFMYYSYVLNLL